MKTHELDSAVRTAFAPAIESDFLGAKISARLHQYRRNRQTKRRLAVSFGTVALAGFAFLAAPVVRADATLARMQGALDGVTALTMHSFSVDEAGHRYASGTTVYDHGKWRLDHVGANTLMIYENGKTYTFDSTLQVFQVEDRLNGPFSHNFASFKVSEMLGSFGNPVTRKAEIDNAEWAGKTVKRVRINNGSLPERYIFFADPDTDLPVHMEVEGKVGNTWRLCSEMNFAYGTGLSPDEFAPELRRFPVITPAESDKRFLADMTQQSLGGFPLKRGRLVVRRIDVADDGTVFVAFQSGYRTLHSWTGFEFNLKDDVGTMYLRPQIFSDGDSSRIPEDGLIQGAAFVPLEPLRPLRPHRYTLTALRFADGNISREFPAIRVEADGKQVKYMASGGDTPDEKDPKPVDVLVRRIEAPTCRIRPSYMERLAFQSFGNDPMAGITEDATRADYCLDQHRWPDAIRWLDAELVQINEFARQGYGPYSENDAKQKLETARAGLAHDARP